MPVTAGRYITVDRALSRMLVTRRRRLLQRRIRRRRQSSATVTVMLKLQSHASMRTSCPTKVNIVYTRGDRCRNWSSQPVAGTIAPCIHPITIKRWLKDAIAWCHIYSISGYGNVTKTIIHFDHSFTPNSGSFGHIFCAVSHNNLNFSLINSHEPAQQRKYPSVVTMTLAEFHQRKISCSNLRRINNVITIFGPGTDYIATHLVVLLPVDLFLCLFGRCSSKTPRGSLTDRIEMKFGRIVGLNLYASIDGVGLFDMMSYVQDGGHDVARCCICILQQRPPAAR